MCSMSVAPPATSVIETDGPTWGDTTGFQAPREYELGLRVTW